MVAHTVVCNHSVGLLGHPLQIVQRTGRDFAEIHLLGSTAAQNGGHLIKQLLFGRNLPLFGQVPGSSQRFTARNNRHFDQRIGMLEHPADRRMARLMVSDRAFLGRSNDFVAAFETAHDAVDRTEEIIFLDLSCYCAQRSTPLRCRH